LAVWVLCMFNLQDYFVAYSSESLDPLSRFVQQIKLEVINVDGYNSCLDDGSIDRSITCYKTK